MTPFWNLHSNDTKTNCSTKRTLISWAIFIVNLLWMLFDNKDYSIEILKSMRYPAFILISVDRLNSFHLTGETKVSPKTTKWLNRSVTKTDYTKSDHSQNGLPGKNMYCKNLYVCVCVCVCVCVLFFWN